MIERPLEKASLDKFNSDISSAMSIALDHAHNYEYLFESFTRLAKIAKRVTNEARGTEREALEVAMEKLLETSLQFRTALRHYNISDEVDHKILTLLK